MSLKLFLSKILILKWTKNCLKFNLGLFHFRNSAGDPMIYQMILAIEEIAKDNENVSDQLSHVENLEESYKVGNITLKTANLVLCQSPRIEIVHGPVVEDRKSVFQGHVGTVFSKEDIG